MTFSRSLFVALTAVALAGLTSTAGAAMPKASFLGLSPLPAVTDGHTVITLGAGAGVKILREGAAPISVSLPEDCRIVAAASDSGASDCRAENHFQFQLVSLTTGATRPMPGSDAVTGPDIASNAIKAMGSRWLTGIYCVPGCQSYALQWQTGELRKVSDSRRLLPVTVLDSTTLDVPPTTPYVSFHDADLKSTWTYRRGRIAKSLRIKLTRGTLITDVRVNGWRVAWVTQRGTALSPSVTTLNMKTGRRTTIPISRFEAAGRRIAPSTFAGLQVTDKRLVVSFVPRGAATPSGEGRVRAVTSLPWPT